MPTRPAAGSAATLLACVMRDGAGARRAALCGAVCGAVCGAGGSSSVSDASDTHAPPAACCAFTARLKFFQLVGLPDATNAAHSSEPLATIRRPLTSFGSLWRPIPPAIRQHAGKVRRKKHPLDSAPLGALGVAEPLTGGPSRPVCCSAGGIGHLVCNGEGGTVQSRQRRRPARDGAELVQKKVQA